MRLTEPVFRPPSEADSLLLPVTVGCIILSYFVGDTTLDSHDDGLLRPDWRRGL